MAPFLLLMSSTTAKDIFLMCRISHYRGNLAELVVMKPHYSFVDIFYTSVSQIGQYRPLGALLRYQGAATQKWAVGGGVVTQNGEVRDDSVAAVAATIKVE